MSLLDKDFQINNTHISLNVKVLLTVYWNTKSFRVCVIVMLLHI